MEWILNCEAFHNTAQKLGELPKENSKNDKHRKSAQWGSTQRHNKDKLDAWQFDMLEAIPGWYWSKYKKRSI